MGVSGACPNCGATVEFTAARSVVTVCESCESVVGRVGEAFENFGKVAELVRTDSPVQLGATGKLQGRSFEIMGRVQLKHATGAVWDEWYAAFDGGESWGWLAEAQGKVHVTFPKRIKSTEATESLSRLKAGASVTLPGVGKFNVAEVGQATIGFAEGEIPYPVRPGTAHRYADLEGDHGRFASLDFSQSPPTIFVGRRVTYEQLGLAHLESREDSIPEAQTLSVNCPTCGGTLELRAPDATARVVCPYCDSLHDVAQGNLKYLNKLRQSKDAPRIPLGTRGTLRGRDYTVIGHLRREVTYEGRKYPWDEYLLATKREPFHWLINANDHWSLGKAVSAGEVTALFRTAAYGGKSFRLFDRSNPKVVALHGEMPWKVQLGETVESADYVAPPLMLSRELSYVMPDGVASGASRFEVEPSGSVGGQSKGWGSSALAAREASRQLTSESDDLAPLSLEDDESRASEDEPLSPDGGSGESGASESGSVEKSNKPKKLPKSSRKALLKQQRSSVLEEVNYTVSEYLPFQEVATAFKLPALARPFSVAPNQPYAGKKLYLNLAIAFAVVLAFYLLLSTLLRPQQVIAITVPQGFGAGQEFWSEPFELKGWRNVRVTSVSNDAQWGYFDGALRNEELNTTREFSMAMEVARPRTKYLSAVRTGTYRLRVRPQFPTMPVSGRTLNITLSQGAVNPTNWWILMGMIGGVGMLVALGHAAFEQARWAESDYSPYGSSSDSSE